VILAWPSVGLQSGQLSSAQSNPNKNNAICLEVANFHRKRT